jgi:ABC-type polysaccharide/polyol phosphate export permease
MTDLQSESAGGPRSLIVNDLDAIPPEPPDDILYVHRVKLSDSLRTLWDHREIVYTLAERDFRAQYKQATLGVLWAVLSPVATLVIFVVIFSRVKAFPHEGIPYALYSFVGIMCWSFFASSLGNGGNSLLANKALLAKTQFPRECFPLETMLVNGLNTVISFIPLTLLFVVFGRAPKLATLWVPMLMVIEVMFAAGLTLAVASLIIQMRDLQQVLPIIISLGIFMTPVIWPFSYVPVHYHVAGDFYINLQAVYGFFNPLGPVITSVRDCMLLGRNPSWLPLGTAFVGSICYLFFGYRIFKRYEVNFADIA